MYWFTQFLPDELRVPFMKLWDRDLPILHLECDEFVKLVKLWRGPVYDIPLYDGPSERLEYIIHKMGYASLGEMKMNMGVLWWDEGFVIKDKTLDRIGERLDEAKQKVHIERARSIRDFMPAIRQVYRGVDIENLIIGDYRLGQQARRGTSKLLKEYFGEGLMFYAFGDGEFALAREDATYGIIQMRYIEGATYWACRPFTQECRAYALELVETLAQAGIGGSTQVFDHLPLPDDPIDRAIVETLKDDPSLTDKELSARLVGKIPGKPDGIGRPAVNMRRGKLALRGYPVEKPLKGKR